VTLAAGHAVASLFSRASSWIISPFSPLFVFVLVNPSSNTSARRFPVLNFSCDDCALPSGSPFLTFIPDSLRYQFSRTTINTPTLSLRTKDFPFFFPFPFSSSFSSSPDQFLVRRDIYSSPSSLSEDSREFSSVRPLRRFSPRHAFSFSDYFFSRSSLSSWLHSLQPPSSSLPFQLFRFPLDCLSLPLKGHRNLLNRFLLPWNRCLSSHQEVSWCSFYLPFSHRILLISEDSLVSISTQISFSSLSMTPSLGTRRWSFLIHVSAPIVSYPILKEFIISLVGFRTSSRSPLMRLLFYTLQVCRTHVQ